MRTRFALSFERGALGHRLRQRSARAGLAIRADRPGMILAADEAVPVALGAKAIVVGPAFTPDGRELNDLGSPDDPRAAATKLWGNFVLFGDQPPFVYRDPSGGFPVYQLDTRDGTCFVSDAGVASDLGLLDTAGIDVKFAVHWLQFPYLRSGRTGIAQAIEIPSGVCRRARRDLWVDELAWNPWDHVRPVPDRALGDSGALRELTLETVAAQAVGHPLLLQLSGGIDSSIIAACLADADIPFSAVNFVTRSADGDERCYARSVAERFGATLAEIHEDELEWALQVPARRAFRPGSNPVLLPVDQAIERHRRRLDNALLVDGGGGDNLFGYSTSSAPVLDALAGGALRQVLRTVGDVARRSECGWWRVAMNAGARMVRGTGPSWREDRTLLRREALLSRPDSHPWLGAPRGSVPGKREHVRSLVEIQHFLDRRFAPGQFAIHPLMARPLLELCLAIPSWNWILGGIDRATARDAFKDLLPLQVARRRGKGSLQGLFQRSFARLRASLRDLLLEGELCRLGIADRGAIEQAFAEDLLADLMQTRLSEMAALELWLQSWRG